MGKLYIFWWGARLSSAFIMRNLLANTMVKPGVRREEVCRREFAFECGMRGGNGRCEDWHGGRGGEADGVSVGVSRARSRGWYRRRRKPKFDDYILL